MHACHLLTHSTRVEQAANYLNLRSYEHKTTDFSLARSLVNQRQKYIIDISNVQDVFGSIDIIGHVGKDDRLYLTAAAAGHWHLSLASHRCMTRLHMNP